MGLKNVPKLPKLIESDDACQSTSFPPLSNTTKKARSESILTQDHNTDFIC